MGNKQRKRQDQEPLSTPSQIRTSARLTEGSDPGALGEAGAITRKTHTVTRLADGTICIGAECAVVRIPPSGDVQIDLRECDEDVQAAVDKLLDEGSGAEIKLKPKGKR